MDSFTYVKDLGSGTYSNVELWKGSDREIVLKRFKNHYRDLSFDIIREISLLKFFNCKNLVKLIDVDKNLNYVVLPKYEMTLLQYTNKYNVPFSSIPKIIHNIGYGLYHLHSYDIVHRDLKMDNIMIKKTSKGWRVIIIDFGMAKTITESSDLTPKISPLDYRAPEILLKNHYGKEIDMWSLGCIIFKMFNKKHPFKAEGTAELILQQIRLCGKTKCDCLGENYSYLPYNTSSWENMNMTIQELNVVKRLLTICPKKRMKIHELLNDPWTSEDACFETTSQRCDIWIKEFCWPFTYLKDRVSPTVTFKMRRILLKWLWSIIETEVKQNRYEVYFYTVHILDFYSIRVPPSRSEYQTVGLVCFWLANKYLSYKPMDILDIIEFSEKHVTEKDLVEYERAIFDVVCEYMIVPSINQIVSLACKEYRLTSQNIEKVLHYMYISSMFPEWVKVGPYALVESCISYSLGQKQAYLLNYFLDQWNKMEEKNNDKH